jgi:hypothetical protein
LEVASHTIAKIPYGVEATPANVYLASWAGLATLSQSGLVACGDIDGNLSLGPDVADLVYLVDYMFNDGPDPWDLQVANVNGDGVAVDVADLVYLVDFMFTGGPDLQCP